MDLSNYRIEELIELKSKISWMISNYEDGYEYLCILRSYGRVSTIRNIKNTHTLQELCYEYSGDDGIVDVYSTNPNLEIDNYGDVMYVKSMDDYEKWKGYEDIKRLIPEIEKEWEDWDNRENVTFNQRPYFPPIFQKEDIEEYKEQLKNYDMSFTPPVRYYEMDKN